MYVRGKQAVARKQSPREYRGRFDEKSLKRARASEGVSKDDGTEAEARSRAERVPAAGALRRRQEQVWLPGPVHRRRLRSATQGVQTRTGEDLSPRGRDERGGGAGKSAEGEVRAKSDGARARRANEPREASGSREGSLGRPLKGLPDPP